MEDVLYTEGEIIKANNQWEASLPDMLYIADFYAVGYDSDENQIGKISLGNIYGHDQYAKYPENCREWLISGCQIILEFAAKV